ncbi:transmembrane protein, putative (macronuclear) [Tetrahymena thermophila SB210]|uniref:Transmembrane protein, putative n=1 Tax=Tetrahymena thermophila (strain SB210) TaxID=312017 RepID=W7XI70_TETTS|nr:transmembrane protein, putative [Tetrahymena thermophila SB210]EWS73054.1 transmembrane protein, putative [Tetrahymena thermophila SB210]|eukprot:XP_012654451.1 transmembrane protein, putative [Tetrahymena thermophila SB210]
MLLLLQITPLKKLNLSLIFLLMQLICTILLLMLYQFVDSTILSLRLTTLKTRNTAQIIQAKQSKVQTKQFKTFNLRTLLTSLVNQKKSFLIPQKSIKSAKLTKNQFLLLTILALATLNNFLRI